MKIECTPQELKELIKIIKETSVAETNAINIKLEGKEIAKHLKTKSNCKPNAITVPNLITTLHNK